MLNDLKTAITSFIRNMLGGSLVTTAWQVLMLQMEMPFRYGGQLQIY
jgi:hypothetical protein